jgi:hypothetical protein
VPLGEQRLPVGRVHLGDRGREAPQRGEGPRGEGHALPAALDHPDAEDRLELAQHRADRGLGQVHRVGRPGDRALAVQQAEQLQVPQLQVAVGELARGPRRRGWRGHRRIL